VEPGRRLGNNVAMADQDRARDWKDTQGGLVREAADGSVGRRRPSASHRPGWTSRPLTLAIATFAAVALVCALSAAFVHWRTEVAAARQLAIEQATARQARELAQQAEREAAERESLRQAKLEREEAIKLQVIAERERVNEAARIAEQEAAERKAKAWAKFYRKPAQCETVTTMDCANAYIRAQRSFEQQWNRGAL